MTETTISLEEIQRSKRAVVTLLERCFKTTKNVNLMPLELRQDVVALMALIRKIEKL